MIDNYDVETLDKNTVIFVKGEPSTELILIKKGWVRVFEETKSSLHFIGKREQGSYLGEHSMLKDNATRRLTSITSEECEIIRVPYKDLNTIIKDGPEWLPEIIKVILMRSQDIHTLVLQHRLDDNIEILSDDLIHELRDIILNYRELKGLSLDS